MIRSGKHLALRHSVAAQPVSGETSRPELLTDEQASEERITSAGAATATVGRGLGNYAVNLVQRRGQGHWR
jgi:hypothetical protein